MVIGSEAIMCALIHECAAAVKIVCFYWTLFFCFAEGGGLAKTYTSPADPPPRQSITMLAVGLSGSGQPVSRSAGQPVSRRAVELVGSVGSHLAAARLAIHVGSVGNVGSLFLNRGPANL